MTCSLHMVRMIVIAFSLALAGCSSFRPWQNPPVDGEAIGMKTIAAAPSAAHSIVAAVTFSGGGARAAAFGLGVLQELKASDFVWEGEPTTLLDEISLVSGVSGGSVLAAYFAAFGDETLTRFESEFLLHNFEQSLIGQALAPAGLYHLTSPWYGRSHVLAERLDKLFRGRTYRDLRSRPHGPDLLVTATDLTTGAPFEFTPEQFALICSDLGSVPLSFAVAASSSVPILLSPMTLRNHAGHCSTGNVFGPRSAATEDNYRVRLLHASAESYLNGDERPYIHLVDGGVTDNLGVRALLDRLIAGGSIRASWRKAPPGSIRKLILIAVNSERDVAERIERSDRVPTTGQVLNTLVFGAGNRESQVTLGMLKDDMERWHRELIEERGTSGSPFSSDAELHVISISLRDVEDQVQRRSLLQVPTAFTIDPEQVRRLEQAGREALRRSPEFQHLRAELRGSGPTYQQALATTRDAEPDHDASAVDFERASVHPARSADAD
jgi:NTE family protein